MSDLYADPDQRQRAKARTRVSQGAHRGERPSRCWPAQDIAWAFEGHEESLARLELIAEEVIEQRQDAHRKSARRADVNAEAQRLLKQWAEDEERERRAKAYAEAERIVAAREAAEAAQQ